MGRTLEEILDNEKPEVVTNARKKARAEIEKMKPAEQEVENQGRKTRIEKLRRSQSIEGLGGRKWTL